MVISWIKWNNKRIPRKCQSTSITAFNNKRKNYLVFRCKGMGVGARKEKSSRSLMTKGLVFWICWLYWGTFRRWNLIKNWQLTDKLTLWPVKWSYASAAYSKIPLILNQTGDGDSAICGGTEVVTQSPTSPYSIHIKVLLPHHSPLSLRNFFSSFNSWWSLLPGSISWQPLPQL